MKTNLPVRITLLLIIMLFLSGVNQSLTAKDFGYHRNKINDSIIIQKTQTSNKYAVKLYPNASNQVLFFSASGEEGKVYQIFLFTMESKLVKQTQIRNRETTLITKPEKGSYMFEVFSDDERIESGNIIIK